MRSIPEIYDLINQVGDIVSPVYLVGGSVRDILLGVKPNDYDFSTPLKPDEVETMVRKAGIRPYVSGKRFGTVGFKLNGHFIEITTFRTETYTAGSRKPSVEFIDNITYDLSRRDFTINAMALREHHPLIDPFGGEEDLKNSTIRTVGNAFDRYNEDPLRMLRAARLVSQLNFQIETETENQAKKKAHKILEVSKERWTKELDKLLTSDNPEIGLNFLARTMLLNYLIPELAIQVDYNQDSPYHELDLWQHTVKTVCLAKNDINIRWAALLHDIGKPYVRTKNIHGYSNYAYHELVGAELTLKVAGYLNWSKERTKLVHKLVNEHLEPTSPLNEADAAATHGDNNTSA